ncbi:unnamed protein product [Pedinophyceae sp. YPF-701]|nr:unnamed protein product [Pedinophyceae sp. YPF-701]
MLPPSDSDDEGCTADTDEWLRVEDLHFVTLTGSAATDEEVQSTEVDPIMAWLYRFVPAKGLQSLRGLLENVGGEVFGEVVLQRAKTKQAVNRHLERHPDAQRWASVRLDDQTQGERVVLQVREAEDVLQSMVSKLPGDSAHIDDLFRARSAEEMTDVHDDFVWAPPQRCKLYRDVVEGVRRVLGCGAEGMAPENPEGVHVLMLKWSVDGCAVTNSVDIRPVNITIANAPETVQDGCMEFLANLPHLRRATSRPAREAFQAILTRMFQGFRAILQRGGVLLRYPDGVERRTVAVPAITVTDLLEVGHALGVRIGGDSWESCSRCLPGRLPAPAGPARTWPAMQQRMEEAEACGNVADGELMLCRAGVWPVRPALGVLFGDIVDPYQTRFPDTLHQSSLGIMKTMMVHSAFKIEEVFKNVGGFNWTDAIRGINSVVRSLVGASRALRLPSRAWTVDLRKAGATGTTTMCTAAQLLSVAAVYPYALFAALEEPARVEEAVATLRDDLGRAWAMFLDVCLCRDKDRPTERDAKFCERNYPRFIAAASALGPDEKGRDITARPKFHEGHHYGEMLRHLGGAWAASMQSAERRHKKMTQVATNHNESSVQRQIVTGAARDDVADRLLDDDDDAVEPKVHAETAACGEWMKNVQLVHLDSIELAAGVQVGASSAADVAKDDLRRAVQLCPELRRLPRALWGRAQERVPAWNSEGRARIGVRCDLRSGVKIKGEVGVAKAKTFSMGPSAAIAEVAPAGFRQAEVQLRDGRFGRLVAVADVHYDGTFGNSKDETLVYVQLFSRWRNQAH